MSSGSANGNGSDGGAMRAFLPGLVLGLVVGLGIGAFAMPFFEGGASLDGNGGGGAPQTTDAPQTTGDTPDLPPAFDERAPSPTDQLTPDQIQDALAEYIERNGLQQGDAPAEDDTPADSDG
ncbi:MAG: hypothetical protein AAGK04_07365 [Planctomycetota bacterium]